MSPQAADMVAVARFFLHNSPERYPIGWACLKLSAATIIGAGCGVVK